jgi:polysaccharide chain length determinant protein (PEP-CTERM system associated)
MERRPLTQVSDYLGVASRRWPLIVVPACIAIFLTLVVSAFLPKAYRSETTILVEPPKVPDSIVKMSNSNDVIERLQTISQQVLSRTQLEQLIEQAGLYRDMKSTTVEDKVELMRQNIQLEQVSDARLKSSDLAAFKISFTGPSPQIAQSVTRQLASLYIQENLKVRVETTEGTTAFVSAELERARERLKETEDKIKEFKGKHMGSLPEQSASNLQLIGQMQSALQNNNDALSRAQQNRAYLQSISESVKVPAALTQEELQLKAKRNELLATEQKYKPEHPDVQRLRREVAALQAQVAANGGGSENQQAISASQLTALDSEIKERTKRSSELEARIRGLQSRLEASPLLEQEWAEINRDYQVQSANYQTLLQKQNTSTLAAQVERDAKGENFKLLDPASYPLKPSKPNMIQVNLGGAVLGLLLGAALAFFREMKDQSIHNENDIRYYVPVALLGTMPEIATQETLAVARRRMWRIVSFGGASVAFALSVIAFLVYRGKIDFTSWF